MSDRARVLHDHHVMLVAASVCTGASWSQRVSLVVAVALTLSGLTTRRWAVLGVGLFAVASTLGAAARAGLENPHASRVRDQWATLLTDPAQLPGGSVGADLRLGHRHVRAYARGPAGDALLARLAGEQVRVSGLLRPVTGVQRARLMPKHISTQLSVSEAQAWRRGNIVASATNRLRRVIARGAQALPESRRPLFGGMVLGDDRGQSDELQDAFKAAGLTHLMVVSGQNVAFALLVASPVLRRGRLTWRFVMTGVVLFGFGVLTRWEPSVLRAEAMAAVAAAGAYVGRPVPAPRLLALATVGCVLLDPLLIYSVGFRLSVAACAGLVALTTPLQRRGVPMVLAATVAAQAGAALVLLPTFGSVPLASLPANVLAVPMAGPLMMWGLVAGPVAGLVPALAPVLHVPSRLMLWWVAGVAQWAASLPIAPIGPAAAVVLALGATGVSVLWHRERTRIFGAVAAGALAVFVGVSAVLAPSSAVAAPVQPGVELWVAEGRSVLVLGGRVGSAVAAELRRRRVTRLDVLVVTSPTPTAASAAWPIVTAFRPRVVLAPEHHQLAGARAARVGAVAVAGPLEVRVINAGPPLEVEVRSRA